jgi:hypothetical protein
MLRGMEFRISWMAIATLCALTPLLSAIVSWPRLDLAAAVAAPFIALGMFLLRRFTVRVNVEGVLLYGRHWLPWSDVLGAKRYSLPVFPYLVVTRRRDQAGSSYRRLRNCSRCVFEHIA